MVSSQNRSPARLSAWSPAIERLVEQLRLVEVATVRARLQRDQLALLEAKKARRRLLGRIEVLKIGAMADDRTTEVVA